MLKKIKFVVFASVIILSFIIGYRLGVYAQIQQSLKAVLEPGSMATEASYVIFTDGSTV